MGILFIKNNKKYTIIILIIVTMLLFCMNCTQLEKNIEDDSIKTIDIIGNISKKQKINLSSLASSIDYCILETNKECLIRNKNIYSSGDYFVYMSEYDCYVFERTTGKFVRQISQRGQGPNDYQYTVKVLDGDKGQILLVGNNQFVFFNLDGTLSHKTKRFTMPDYIVAHENLYILYVSNNKGNSTIRIAFFDKTGELIDSIPNYRFYNISDEKRGVISVDFTFHQFNNNLYYKDIYCDTLYQIKDFTLEPRYIFNTGSRTVPYKLQMKGPVDIQAMMAGRENDRYAKYIVIKRFFESTNFLFFTFDYQKKKYPVIFNKNDDKIHIISPISHPLNYLRDGDIILPFFGLENDFDGGLPFWPQQMISEKEMMCVYTAQELLELDTSHITNPKLKSLLSILKEDDNPVVAIVTLKD